MIRVTNVRLVTASCFSVSDQTHKTESRPHSSSYEGFRCQGKTQENKKKLYHFVKPCRRVICSHIP